VAWLDRLPWELACASTQTAPGESHAFEQLVANLDHHQSDIRIWMMEMAWCVRNWLRPERALPPLLRNVASKLAGVDLAWGLAAALYADTEALVRAAEAWVPDDFADQYRDRLSRLKADSFRCQAELWSLEANCRALALDAAIEVIDTLHTVRSSGATK
jgi:hypothetical protein